MGRSLGNTLTVGVQGSLLVPVAIPFGLLPEWGVVVTTVLTSLMALGLSAASYSMGILREEKYSFAPFVPGVSLPPLPPVSGVLLPTALTQRNAA